MRISHLAIGGMAAVTAAAALRVGGPVILHDDGGGDGGDGGELGQSSSRIPVDGRWLCTRVLPALARGAGSFCTSDPVGMIVDQAQCLAAAECVVAYSRGQVSAGAGSSLGDVASQTSSARSGTDVLLQRVVRMGGGPDSRDNNGNNDNGNNNGNTGNNGNSGNSGNSGNGNNVNTQGLNSDLSRCASSPSCIARACSAISGLACYTSAMTPFHLSSLAPSVRVKYIHEADIPNEDDGGARDRR
jgi:hypothetical protein